MLNPRRWHRETCQVCDLFVVVSHDAGPITPHPHERLPADVVYRAEPEPIIRNGEGEPICVCTYGQRCGACSAGG